MIISFVCGGLGNQMFQYAAGRRLALRHGSELKLDLREYDAGVDVRPTGLEAFRRPLKLSELCATVTPAAPVEVARLRDPYSTTTTTARIVRRVRRIKPGFLWPASHIREQQYRFEPHILDLPDDVYLDGYWQSWKYFDDVADRLRQDFQPRDPQVGAYARQYVDRLRTLGGPVVAVHVRRGDLARAHEEMNKGHIVHGAPVGTGYIYAAMQRFGPEHQFLLFSDTAKDIEWCRQNVKPEWLAPQRLHFADGHSDIQDMALMSACDHNIIANSTFSWWSAWLNPNPQRRVVSPRVWSTPGSAVNMVIDDLLPGAWEVI
jgi:hypothetical protein